MKRVFPLLPLAFLAATACEAVTGVAPADTPRIETELVVVVNRDFLAAFDDVEMSSELVHEVKELIRSQADLGLRFYAMPAESYGEGHVRPPHLMTVTIDSLDVVLEEELIEEEGASPRFEVRVDELVCTVSASLVRRRADAPALVIAEATESRNIGAENDPEELLAEPGYAPSADRSLKVLHRDVVRAADGAVNRALKAMRTPIDREFRPEAPPEE